MKRNPSLDTEHPPRTNASENAYMEVRFVTYVTRLEIRYIRYTFRNSLHTLQPPLQKTPRVTNQKRPSQYQEEGFSSFSLHTLQKKKQYLKKDRGEYVNNLDDSFL